MTATTTQPGAPPAAPAEESELYGLLAEFEDPDTLLHAAEKVRDAGYRQWEVYTPYPIHGMDRAMGQEMTRLPWIVLICGLTGLLGGLVLVWWTNAQSMGMPFNLYGLRGYDFIISGKPEFSLPANIPPIFELTILFSAFGAFFGMLALNLLPRFWHPVFNSPRFDRATQDRFFIGIAAADGRFDAEQTQRLLSEAGAGHIEQVEQEA